MGQGSRRITTYFSTGTVSPLVLGNVVGEFFDSGRNMASGHSRSSSCDSSASSSAGYIEHPVSRFDTLAGVAIKYGVEVADIKRMNGLVTDLQMFALKTLKIPLPGRHLPASTSNNPGFAGKPTLGKQPNPVLAQILKDSVATTDPDKRSPSSAMGLLRGYYGLAPTAAARHGPEGTEMAVYRSDTDHHSEDEPFSPFLPFSPQEMGSFRHQNDGGSSDSGGEILNAYDYQTELHPGAGKAKATVPFEAFSKPNRVTVFKLEPAGDAGGGTEIERANERLFRRRAKGESAPGPVPDISSEMFIPPEVVEVSDRNTNVPLGKSSALRQKIPPPLDDSDSVSRPSVNSSLNGWHTSSDSSSGLAGSAVRALSTSLLGGKTVEGLISKIRRSGSTSTLHEEKKSYKAESSGGTLMVSYGSSQSLSSVLEGFPKAGGAVQRRNKAALD